MLLIPRYDGPSGNPSVISENQIPGCRNHEQHILNTFGRFPRAAAGSILSSPLRGSLSLEAAILIPVFLTLVIAVLSFMNLIAVQLTVDRALSETGEELAVYGGIKEELVRTPEKEERLSGFVKQKLLDAAFSELLVRTLVTEKLSGTAAAGAAVTGGLSGISYLGSSYDAARGRIELKASYRLRQAIFPSFTGRAFTQKSVHRIWSGDVTAAGSGGESGTETENEEGQTVYVTEQGTVYHLTTSCSALSLTVCEASAAVIAKLRNESGHIFYPCEHCDPVLSGTLYYTPYGECYHSDRNCSGLKRTVRAVPLSEVSGLPACKRCGGSHE